MIKLNGPLFAESGTTVCITATNVGSGFSAKASVTGGAVVLKIEIDPILHTATVCYTMPAAGATVIINASDSGTTIPETIATVSL